MSYARWGDSEIYMFAHVDGGITCMVCPLMPRVDDPDAVFWFRDWWGDTPAEAINHLREHVAAGHNIGEAIERIECDMASGEPWPPRSKDRTTRG